MNLWSWQASLSQTRWFVQEQLLSWLFYREHSSELSAPPTTLVEIISLLNKETPLGLQLAVGAAFLVGLSSCSCSPTVGLLCSASRYPQMKGEP